MADEIIDVSPRYQNPDTKITSTTPVDTPTSEGILAFLSTHWIGVCLILVLIIIGLGAAYFFCKSEPEPVAKKKTAETSPQMQTSTQTQVQTPPQVQTQTPAHSASKSELDAILNVAQNPDAATIELMDDGTDILVDHNKSTMNSDDRK